MADITLILRDQFSNKANAIANANKGLSKSMEDVQNQASSYTKRLTALNESLAKQQTALVSAKKELNEAKKAFTSCATAVNHDALTEAYKKYNSLNDEISNTRKSAKETREELRKLNDEVAKRKGGDRVVQRFLIQMLCKIQRAQRATARSISNIIQIPPKN